MAALSYSQSPRRQLRGAALLWAIVFIAIITAIAATVSPFTMQANDMDNVVETANRLRRVATAVQAFDSLIETAPGFGTPATLTLLTTSPVSGAGAGCTGQSPAKNNNYNNLSVQDWAAYGPFGQYVMSSAGLWTPLGTLNDAPSRASTTIGTKRTSLGDPYFIQVENVNVQLARLLDAYVDNAPNAAADTVWYTTAAADSTVTVSWKVFLPHPTQSC